MDEKQVNQGDVEKETMRPSTAKFRYLPIGAVFLLLLGGAGSVYGATGSGLLQARQGVSALLRGKYEQAVASYTQALEDRNLSDPRRANIYNDRGVAKWRLGQSRDAVEDFNKAIGLFPDYSVVYNNRGNALLDLKQPQEAIADFDRAIALAPAYGAAFNNRGNAYHSIGNFEAAARDFRKAVALMPTSGVPFNGRGKVHSALGRHFAAVRDFNRAIVLNAKYYSAHQNRAEAQVALGDHDGAVADYTQIIALKPDNAALHLARGRAFAKARKYNSAFRDFDKALKLAPEMADVYLERANIHMKLKRYKSAGNDFTAVIALRPEDHELYTKRAETALRLGKGEAGLEDVTRVLVLKPGDTDALMIRAKIYESLGRNYEAIADYAAVWGDNPSHAGARAGLTALGQELPDEEVLAPELPPQVGKPFKGWVVRREPDGKYIATNKRYPKARVQLEMYGPGEPQIIEWNLLKYDLRGIGLLEYYAGTLPEDGGKRLEYVAIVDLWKSRAVAIEPDSWGSSKAKWDWKRVSVVVTDPEGGANEIKLRRAKIDPYGERRDGTWFGGGFWQVDPPATQRRTRKRRQAPRGGGLFDWLR